ncbi:DUF1850 domain-containing protein [Paroceanicella profunda]|uniref:DUF1850 domain-containing protein n=1 Tax=Paroceanicella profunda TaxID=2579971 RepID=A0A5B8G2Y6_9RHOB|nr:DUF1850 domain-containing protein [Paroceanicella profunda]
MAGGGLLALLFLPSAGLGAVLTATLPDGREIAHLSVPEGSGWCVLWRHSVKGFEVKDCYENRAGHMVLVRSHQPDFAAGLGHWIGRGRQVSDGAGGYWIEDIDEPVPGDAYVLRPGTMAVNHRLKAASGEVSLSALATHARVTIALEPAPPSSPETTDD